MPMIASGLAKTDSTENSETNVDIIQLSGLTMFVYASVKYITYSAASKFLIRRRKNFFSENVSETNGKDRLRYP